MWRLGVLFLLYVVYGLSSISTAAAIQASDFDDEFEAFDRGQPSPDEFLKPLMSKKPAPAFRLQSPETYYPEAFFLLLLIAYAINFWRGRQFNDSIVTEWATCFCKPGKLLDRNFALVGPGYDQDGGELVMKNSHSDFHLWASGRR